MSRAQDLSSSSGDDPDFVPEEDSEEEEAAEVPSTFLKWVIPKFASAPNELESPIRKEKYCETQVKLSFDASGKCTCTVVFLNIEEDVTFDFVVTIQPADTRYYSGINGSGSFCADQVPNLKEYQIPLEVGMKRSELASYRRGFVRDDGSLLVTLKIREFGDSKKETGYIGLKNQGATCYMNSVLQSLFHLPAFRKIVYNMPTSGTEDEAKCIPLNLQRLFCSMQFSKKAVSTKKLTASFGWGGQETFMQHDVQEFCRVLMDNLEEKMKGTDMEKSIADLFRGKTRRYIRCVNVDFESSQEQEFYDLSMVVKGCKSLKESFEKYCEKERMDGDNQYQTDKFGKQDADMGVEFVEFPPVLQLHLGRFEYDFNYDTMVKINDRFEFPTVIDLSPYLAGDGDKPSCEYELFGVLVHMGNVVVGHYYSFLRTTPDQQWFKFDDEWVTKEESATAIDDNFGGVTEYHRWKSYSGYMLVYVKRSEIPRVFEPIADSAVPDHLKEYMKMEEERLEARRNAKLHAEQTVEVLIQDKSTLEKGTLMGSVGFYIKDGVINERFDKTLTTADIYQEVAKRLERPAETIRLWMCNTYGWPVKVCPCNATSLEILDYYLTGVRLFLQEKDKEDTLQVKQGDIVLYVKFFFPKAEAPIQFIDTLTFSETEPLTAVAALLNQRLGYPEGTPMLAFLEQVTGLAKRLDIEATIEENQLTSGCIVIFQLEPGTELPTTFELKAPISPPQPEEAEKPETETEAPADKTPIIDADELMQRKVDTIDYFLAKRLCSAEIPVYDYNDTLMPRFILRFVTTLPLASLKKILVRAAKLDFNPEKDSILVYSRDYITFGPRPDPIASSQTVAYITKQDGLSFKEQRLYMLFVEGVNEAQLTSMAQYTIELATNGYTVDHTVSILAEKLSTCGDLLEKVKDKTHLDLQGPFRFYQVYDGKSYAPYGPLTTADYLPYPFCPLRIDVVPEDQRDLKDDEYVVEVCQYVPSIWGGRYLTPAGEPFYLKVFGDEKFSATKERILPHLHEEKQKEFKEMSFLRDSKSKAGQRTALKDDDTTTDILAPGDRLFLISKNKASTGGDAVKIYN